MYKVLKLVWFGAMILSLFQPIVRGAPPENDSFSSPIVVTGFPVWVFGETSEATLEPGEEAPFGWEGSVWFEWTAHATTNVEMQLGTMYNMALQVWTGDSLHSLTLIGVNKQPLQTICGPIEWPLALQVISGVTYRIAAYGFNYPYSDYGFRLWITNYTLSEISGRITGPDGIAPISGIKVTANHSIVGLNDHPYPPDFGYGWFHHIANYYRWHCYDFTVMTDSNGQYEFFGLPALVYSIHFEDPSGTFASEYYDNAVTDFSEIHGVMSALLSTRQSTSITGINASLSYVYPPMAATEPSPITACESINIIYHAGYGPISTSSVVYARVGRNNWSEVLDPVVAMVFSAPETNWIGQFDIPMNTINLNVTFHDGDGTEDLNLGTGWSFPVTGCLQDPSTIISNESIVISSPIEADSNVYIQSLSGSVTFNAAVTSSNGNISVQAATAISSAATLSAPNGLVGVTSLSGNLSGGIMNGILVTLRSGGSIMTTVSAESLDVGAANSISLATSVATLSVTNQSGAITVNEADAVTLTNVRSGNGSITVTAGGLVTANNVQSLTDNDANDITIAGSEIVAGTIIAGSAGDAFLQAGWGSITDGAGKIVADQLTAGANGSLLLDTTVNEVLSATNQLGPITVTETDDVILTSVRSGNGSISVTEAGMIVVAGRIDAGISEIRLLSSSVITQTMLGAVVSSGLVFRAASAAYLTSLSNDVGTIAGVVTAAPNSGLAISIRDMNDLRVGTVNGVSGITLNQGQIEVIALTSLIVENIISISTGSGGTAVQFAPVQYPGGSFATRILPGGGHIKIQFGVTAALYDFNGDGASDLSVFNPVNGSWYIRSASGAALAWNNQWGWNTALPVPGDYDGDGKFDLTVFDRVGGFWYAKSLAGNVITWKNQWGWSTAKPVPGDYNGNGSWDQAVFDAAGGFWYIKSVSGSLISWKNQWGGSATRPVPGDYNGDGYWDQAVFDTAGGFWYIKSVSGSLISWKNQWGWSTAKPVPGDYNGDGNYDLAVFDTSGGYWYIKTLAGEIISWKNQWGWSMAQPVSGDFDGDGIFDLAVVDILTGRWYIKSLDGRIIAWNHNWGWSGATFPSLGN